MNRTPANRRFRPDALDDSLESRDLLAPLVFSQPVVTTSAGTVSAASAARSPFVGRVNYSPPLIDNATHVLTRVSVRPSSAASGLNVNLSNAGRVVFTSATQFPFGGGERNLGLASTTGLAFTNGLGFNDPLARSAFFNNSTNGLIFNNGLAANTSPASNSDGGRFGFGTVVNTARPTSSLVAPGLTSTGVISTSSLLATQGTFGSSFGMNF